MKSSLKFAFAALAAMFVISNSVSADETRLVQVFNHHGSSMFMYERTDALPTVAFYNGGAAFADRVDTVQDQNLRLKMRPNHHGQRNPEYVDRSRSAVNP